MTRGAHPECYSDARCAFAAVTRSEIGARGFTLIEIMIALVLLSILVAIAYPSYRDYVIRASRAAAQEEVLQLSSVQEKIYLNSNGYSNDVTGAYNGNATGGLGKTSGRTSDAKYDLSMVAAGQSYILTATPVAGSMQQNDGAFSVASDGTRTCTTPSRWCVNSTW